MGKKVFIVGSWETLGDGFSEDTFSEDKLLGNDVFANDGSSTRVCRASQEVFLEFPSVGIPSVHSIAKPNFGELGAM